jgi:hypothetical protein
VRNSTTDGTICTRRSVSIRTPNTKNWRRKRHLWRIAAAGNAAALVLLTFVLAHSPLLFDHVPPVSPTFSNIQELFPAVTFDAAVAGRVLLVVVDGVRAEDATDPQRMPQLGRLAREGGSGIAQVEALIPSTVAAIQTLVTGRVPPPAAFLEDFGARPAREGGLFAAVVAHDQRAFVAGPRLWADLYGAWVTRAATVAGWGDEDDQHSLRAAVAALAQGSYQLVVVHFSRADTAAHRYGAHSPAYGRAVAWYDAAIGQLLERAGAQTAVVVTSDHGVTAYGGHAGPEPEVLATPLVTWGPGTPRGLIGTIPQRSVSCLVLHALGLTRTTGRPDSAVPVGAFCRSEQSQTPTHARHTPFDSAAVPFMVFALTSVTSGLCLWAALAGGTTGKVEATALNAALWTGLLLFFLGWRTAALSLIILVLVMTAFRTRPGSLLPVLRALAAGVLFGVIRIVDGVWTSQSFTANVLCWSASPTVGAALLSLAAVLAALGTWRFIRRTGQEDWNSIRVGCQETRRWVLVVGACAAAAYALGGLPLLGLYILTVALGVTFGSALHNSDAAAFFAGTACVFAPVALARLLGETVSLSTLDVRVAFKLMEEAGGLPAAVIAILSRHAVLTWGVLLGLAPAFPQARPMVTGCFASGLAVAWAAQALVAGAVLALSGPDLVLGSLALGTLARVFTELTSGFLGCAFVCWLGHAREA